MNIENKVLFLIGILLFIFTLSACKQTEPSHENVIMENEQEKLSYSFKNPNTGQEFNIIHAYLLYENFFETVKDNTSESHHRLFEEEVIEPIFEACFKDAEHYKLSVFDWTPEESDFNSITTQVETIDKDHINKLFEESLVKSSEILPSDNKTTVCVFPKNESFPPMGTIGSGEILVFLNEEVYDDFYKSGMSHEYHHSVWFERNFTVDDLLTVLDSLIMEGQALMFETLVYPDSNSTHYMVDESFNKEYWGRIEPYLESSSNNEFLIGGFNGLPNYYGYSEGYKMIRSYLNLHPNMPVEEWTSKSPKEIFEEGNYVANYK